MTTFSEAKDAFDSGPGRSPLLKKSLVPVHGKQVEDIRIRNARGEALEEYYKWQFVYALINCGLYPREVIGVEVHFPKGSTSSQALKIDGAIFDDPEWLEHYNRFWKDRRTPELQWLNDHLLAVVEFKRRRDPIERVFTVQVKPAMREKEPSNAYVMGMYYDAGRLFLFHRRDGRYLRLDESKNQKGDKSTIGDLSLHLPDGYAYIPAFEHLKNAVQGLPEVDRRKRKIGDLDVITSITSSQLMDALSNVLRVLDKHGLFNQRGFDILIQAFALKIYDEKRNEQTPGRSLDFYIEEDERAFASLRGKAIQTFIKRTQKIAEDASGRYEAILTRAVIDWRDINHVRAMASVCDNFQDFSFVRSSKSDLYQLVFYNFANKFQQQEKAQFLTPIAVIDFLVNIVHPRNGETVFDPCCGISDFLSLSYVNALQKSIAWRLKDANIYGVDVSPDMITLASLNMLLNGDGEAHLFQIPGNGSIAWKIKQGNPPEPVELIPGRHKQGNWDSWPDKTKLVKFDVVLTNPPFGEDRAFRPETEHDLGIAETYETWGLAGTGGSIDLGVVFLENACRVLKVGGRFGIVLSNSIASIDRVKKVRKWLLGQVRIVALFDLPANMFAETGVNTTIIVAYKPKAKDLKRLREDGYSVFVRDIENVGYEKRTSKRNVFFNPIYRIDEKTFEIETDGEGNAVLLEDFTTTLDEFRLWAAGQESQLVNLFLKEE